MRNRFSICFLSGIFLVILYCNYCMPMFVDDYWYTSIFGNGGTVSSLKDVFISQWNHYFTHGGRSVAHIFVQSFLYFGKGYFDVVNALVFVGLILLIYKVAILDSKEFKWDVRRLAFIFFALWFCIKDFGQTVFWLTGACNYLWMTTLALSFLLPYKAVFTGSLIEISPNYIPVFLFWGILAGWTNENTGLTVIMVSSVFVYLAARKGDSPRPLLFGIMGACLGYFLMIAAPGNFVRTVIYEDVTIVQQLSAALKTTVTRLFVKQLPLWIGLGMIWYKCKKHRLWPTYQNEISVIFVFVAASIFNNLVMFASPSFPGRAGFASTVFLIVALIQGLRLLDQANLRIFSIAKVKRLRIVTAIYMCLSISITIWEYHILHAQDQARTAFVLEEKARGTEKILVEPYTISGEGRLSHVYIADIYFQPNRDKIWTNEVLADYYGVKTIQLKYKRND